MADSVRLDGLFVSHVAMFSIHGKRTSEGVVPLIRSLVFFLELDQFVWT
jgi:hypothetical protein